MNDPASGEDLTREETIFHAAVELRDPAKQAMYLDLACEGAPGLRARLERLLASDAGDYFFAKPLAQASVLHSVTSEPGICLPQATLGPAEGERIGHYRLFQKLGEGGCGVVYMAEQEEPVRRRVALKIIKLGMDTRSVIARFEAERQALALMDHPNIAKVLDAGATETGRPFFVMELVGGIKITDYCEQNHLDTRQRLDLFIQVCRAVQHAHQKGVIHRDIKPSNVLVATQDGVPVPKIIDFGIAKATQGKLTDHTVFTAFEQFLGTPAYMSPEQAQVGGLDVDTRSDIYSLGVLLYELLTGKTPFDPKELVAAGLDAMRRTIQEREPPTPSSRLARELTTPRAANEKQKAETARLLETRQLVKTLRGDLDWIVMKCLEKDRGHRYDTANGLAMDLYRYANHEPVLARSPTNVYRLQKLVKRHKLAFAAGAAVCASTLIGLSVSTALFFRERAAREQARQGAEAAREQAANAKEQEAIARAVSAFLQEDLLQQANSWSQADAQFAPNPNLSVREALERAASRIGDRFKNQPLQEAAVRSSIGMALLGVGEAERATPHLQRAVDLRRVKLGSDHPETLESMNNVADAYQAAGKLDQALPLFEETLKLTKTKLGPDHPETLRSMNNLAGAYVEAGKANQALPLLEETLELAKTRLGPDHPNILASMNNLAAAYLSAGKLDQALPLYEQTLLLSKTKLGPEHPDTLTSMNVLAVAYHHAGKLDQALPLYEETLKLMKAKLGPDHPNTLTSMNNLAMGYQATGNLDQALPLYEETLKLRRAKLGPDHSSTLASMNNLANACQAAGKPDQVLPLLEETLKLRRAKLGLDHPDTLASMNSLGSAFGAAGKLDQALPLLEETFKLAKAKLGPGHPDTLQVMDSLANAFRVAGKLDQALSLYEEMLKLRKTKLGPEHPDTLKSMSGLSLAYLAAGKPSESEHVARECLGIYETKFPNNWRTFSTKGFVGGSLLAQKKYAEAEPLLLSAVEGMTQREAEIPHANKHVLKQAIENLVQLYESTGRTNQAAKWQAKLSQSGRVPTASSQNSPPKSPP